MRLCYCVRWWIGDMDLWCSCSSIIILAWTRRAHRAGMLARAWLGLCRTVNEHATTLLGIVHIVLVLSRARAMSCRAAPLDIYSHRMKWTFYPKMSRFKLNTSSLDMVFNNHLYFNNYYSRWFIIMLVSFYHIAHFDCGILGGSRQAFWKGEKKKHIHCTP